MKKIAPFLCIAGWLAALGCQQQGKSADTRSMPRVLTTSNQADSIVNQIIIYYGGDLYDNSIIRFTFRNRRYKVRRRGGSFEYERVFTDSLGQTVRDVFNNGGLYREINSNRLKISEKDSSAYASSINSVVYFALLPAPLNDPAVIREYLGETTIKGQPYHKIRITFRQDGGGKDFEDEYVYWFHRDEGTMAYLAYNYLTDGGGARFREAFNIRDVHGIRFADYINYKPKDANNRDVRTFDQLFETGQLEELSRIETEDIEVIIIQ